MSPVDLNLGLDGTHVLVTGGAGMIGSAVVSAFLSAGATVSVFDVSASKIKTLEETVLKDEAAGLYHKGPRLVCRTVDISDELDLSKQWGVIEYELGPVACCVALASLDLSVLEHHPGGIADMSLAQWERTLKINVTGTFLTAREWVRRLREYQETQSYAKGDPKPALKNRGLIIIGSESGLFGERSNPDYATGKSAVQGGLLASLKADVPRTLGNGARVNAVAPGPVDTEQFKRECKADPGQYYADARATVALGKPVDVECVARSVVFLASERWSGNVHGTVLQIDSGKEGKLMWREGEA